MGYFGALIDDLGNRVKDFDIAQTANRDIAKRYINRSAQWIYVAHHWEQRQKMGQLTLIPNYTAGTCTITQFDGTNEDAARTVTFSAALPANIQGRFFQVQDGLGWHKISYTNGNIAYLETPVLDSSGNYSFKIWKRFYYLPGDVAAITDFGKWDGRLGRMEYKSFAGLVDTVAGTSNGTPGIYTPFGLDNYESAYAVGSISMAVDSNIIDGIGTTWLGSVQPGDQVIIGTKVFTIKRAETNTRLILNNFTPEVVPTTAYEIRRNLSIGFQFYPNEITNYLTIPFYYQDKIFDMVHETKDRPPLPDDFDDAILTRAEFKLKKDKSDSNWIAIAQLFERELGDLKINFRVVRPRYDIFAPEVRGMPGR